MGPDTCALEQLAAFHDRPRRPAPPRRTGWERVGLGVFMLGGVVFAAGATAALILGVAALILRT